MEEGILFLCLLFLGLDFEELAYLMTSPDDKGNGPSHVVASQQLGPEASL